MRPISLLGLTLLIPLGGFFAPVDAEPPREQTPALAAARARQEAARSIEIEFRLTETRVKAQRGVPLAKVVPAPENTATATCINRLVLDGKKVRVENNFPKWNPYLGWREFHCLTTFNGVTGKAHTSNKAGLEDVPEFAIISDRLGEVQFHSAETIPLTAAFRGLDGFNYQFPLTEFKLTEKTLAIDGAECQEHVRVRKIGSPEEQRESVTRCWIDPKKDQVIRRIVWESSTAGQIDIEYRKDEVHGWVPSSWVRKYSPFVNYWTTCKAEVVKIRFNPPLDADQFDLTFPEGTRVVRRPPPAKEYIVEADGTLREVLPPIPRAPIPPDRPAPVSNEWLAIAVCAGLLAVAVGFLVLRARRSRGVTSA